MVGGGIGEDASEYALEALAGAQSMSEGYRMRLAWLPIHLKW